jgi:hypothetical protein
MSGASQPPAPAGAAASADPILEHLDPVESAQHHLQRVTERLHGMTPLQPLYGAARRAQDEAVMRLTAAQEAAAQQSAAASHQRDAQTDYPTWMIQRPDGVSDADFAAGRDTMVTAIRAVGFNMDEFKAATDIYGRAAQGREFDPARERKVLINAWGANFDPNMAVVRAEVQRMGPEARAWLEETGLGNSAELAHLILSAARRHGRASW